MAADLPVFDFYPDVFQLQLSSCNQISMVVRLERPGDRVWIFNGRNRRYELNLPVLLQSGRLLPVPSRRSVQQKQTHLHNVHADRLGLVQSRLPRSLPPTASVALLLDQSSGRHISVVCLGSQLRDSVQLVSQAGTRFVDWDLGDEPFAR